MDSVPNKSHFSDERDRGFYRLNDASAGIFLKQNELLIEPSDSLGCVQLAGQELSLYDSSNKFVIKGSTNEVERYSIGNFTEFSPTLQAAEGGISVKLTDSSQLELAAGSLIRIGQTSQCLLDIHGTYLPHVETPQLLTSPNNMIDYGIIRANGGLALSLSEAGVSIPTEQDILIKDNSICLNPINYLRAESPLSLSLDESGYLRANSTMAESLLSGIADTSIINAIDASACAINWNNITQGYFGSNLDTFRVQDRFVGLSNSYNEVLASSIDGDLLAHATKNYLADTSFVAVSATNLDEERDQLVQRYYEVEDKGDVVGLLRGAYPGLVDMYNGAIGALNSGNPDRVRHFSVSLRELFTHILDRAAPDNAISEWCSEPSFFYRGKPTKKARLRFITRKLHSDKFQEYLAAELMATKEFLNLFQRGTHAVESGYTESQLDAMRLKADATIKLLLLAADISA